MVDLIINYKNMKIAILITLIVSFLAVFLLSCKTMFNDEKLTLQRRNYTENTLRIDGYYYYFVQESNRTVVHFFYRNGIVLWGGTYATVDINEVETEMVKLYSEIRKMKDSWGLFLIDNSIIQHEGWVEALNGVSLAIYRRSGYIVNDTTIHFTDSYYSGRKETKRINETWHFKQFDNKPDSTNHYIQ
jgi:hypothetical protein